MNKQDFLAKLSALSDKALMMTDTLEGTKRVNGVYRYSRDMAATGLATFEESLQIFKRRTGLM